MRTGRRPVCLAWRLGRRPKWRAECGTGRAAGPSAAQLRSSAAGSAGLSGCGENGPQACVSGMKIGPQAQAANRPQACVSGNRAAGLCVWKSGRRPELRSSLAANRPQACVSGMEIGPQAQAAKQLSREEAQPRSSSVPLVVLRRSSSSPRDEFGRLLPSHVVYCSSVRPNTIIFYIYLRF